MLLKLGQEVAQQAGAVWAEGLIGGREACDAVGAKGAKILAHLAFGEQHQRVIHKDEREGPYDAVCFRAFGIGIVDVDGFFVACGQAECGDVDGNFRPLVKAFGG